MQDKQKSTCSFGHLELSFVVAQEYNAYKLLTFSALYIFAQPSFLIAHNFSSVN